MHAQAAEHGNDPSQATILSMHTSLQPQVRGSSKAPVAPHTSGGAHGAGLMGGAGAGAWTMAGRLGSVQPSVKKRSWPSEVDTMSTGLGGRSPFSGLGFRTSTSVQVRSSANPAENNTLQNCLIGWSTCCHAMLDARSAISSDML